MRCNFNMKQKERLTNVVVKHKQVLSNIVGFRIVEINNINLPIEKLDNKMLCKLFVDMKIISREIMFLAIEKLQQGEYILQVKHKQKDEASVYVSYLPKQLVKLY